MSKLAELIKMRENISSNIDISFDDENEISEGAILDTIRTKLSKILDPFTNPKNVHLANFEDFSAQEKHEITDKIDSAIIAIYNLNREQINNAHNAVQGLFNIDKAGKIVIRNDVSKQAHTFEELISRGSQAKTKKLIVKFLSPEYLTKPNLWTIPVKYVSKNPFEVILKNFLFGFFKEDLEHLVELGYDYNLQGTSMLISKVNGNDKSGAASKTSVTADK